MDGSTVTVDLLQRGVAAGVPDGDGPIFTARNQEAPCWVQARSVNLEENQSPTIEATAAHVARSVKYLPPLTPESCSNSASSSNWDLLRLEELMEGQFQTCQSKTSTTARGAVYLPPAGTRLP